MTFTEVFRARVEAVEADAKSLGLNFTSICREAKISRATPDRWKKNPPKTVEILSKMEGIVARHRAQAK